MYRGLFYRTVVVLLVLSIGGAVMAQRGQGRGGGGRGGGGRGRAGGFAGGLGLGDQLPADRSGIPTWNVDPHFKSDIFTFVRIEFDSYGNRGANAWRTDWPDSDLNFPFRLQQMTSMKVNPNSITMRLTDPELFNYPFIYMLEVGGLGFSSDEVEALRRYCLNGGFLMVDDHWGLSQQANFRSEIHRVFPDRELQELDLSHPIFHCVFDLKAKPQVPGINTWVGGGRTWESSDDREPHYRAIYDDKGRMMVLQCANTDLGDGWEREGVNEEYFHMFSEKQAYPMAINIVFWAMTH
jgi:hypothetical protein